MQAEDLVFRLLQSEISAPIRRNVRVGKSDIAFDGFARSGNAITLIEVKLLKNAVFSTALIQQSVLVASELSSQVHTSMDAQLKLLLVFVIDTGKDDGEGEIRERIQTVMEDAVHVRLEKQLNFELTHRIYQLDEIKKAFGIA